ncbi:MAG: hypothetical protein ACON3Z_02640 [Bradymonadia bacterium]
MKKDVSLTAKHWVMLAGALWSLLYTLLYRVGAQPSRLPPGFTEASTYYAKAAFLVLPTVALMTLSVAYSVRVLIDPKRLTLNDALELVAKPYLLPLTVTLILPEIILIQFTHFGILQRYAPYGGVATAIWMSAGLYGAIYSTGSCTRMRAIVATLLAAFAQACIAGLILR